MLYVKLTVFGDVQAPVLLSPAASQWIAATRQELKELMWTSAGIVRNTASMQKALTRIGTLCQEVKAMAKSSGISSEMLELQNLSTVGELIMASALQRKESRGLHYCTDYPFIAQDQCHPTVIKRKSKRHGDMGKLSLVPRQHGVQSRPVFRGKVPASANDVGTRKNRELARTRSLREE